MQLIFFEKAHFGQEKSFMIIVDMLVYSFLYPKMKILFPFVPKKSQYLNNFISIITGISKFSFSKEIFGGVLVKKNKYLNFWTKRGLNLEVHLEYK